MCHSLVKARGDTVPDDINQVMVSHLGPSIKSTDIIVVFLDRTYLFAIIDPVKSPVWLLVVATVFSNGILDLFPSITPVFIGFPPFQHIPFGT